MRRYRCTVSAHIYDPAEGDPASGVAAGTAFADLPADWVCPDCGASRSDSEPMD
ncbi:MAG: rubredoxin [Xanthomonadales bacterium]|nr:rubredoxin [Xanthomonadales bacterium]MCP5475315.1 rubredoxin [Rhodanobacteraceae bacterium]